MRGPTTEPDGEGIGALQSLVLGIVEGLTEFLPVSSTGHLIVTNAAFDRSDPTFEVAIQAGAITAILVLYWRDLWRAVTTLFGQRQAAAADAPRGANLLWLILVAALPAAVVGLLLEETLDAWLFNPPTVAIALVLGGVAFLVVERAMVRRAARGAPADARIGDMSLRDALLIGCWQTLALIPGTSRSGATIVGGMLSGYSRAAAAEFSFLVGLPILYGACLLKVWKDFERVSGPLLPALLLASAAAFVTAIAIVGPFVRFLQAHTFAPFAYYRIAAGAAIYALWATGWLGG